MEENLSPKRVLNVVREEEGILENYKRINCPKGIRIYEKCC